MLLTYSNRAEKATNTMSDHYHKLGDTNKMRPNYETPLVLSLQKQISVILFVKMHSFFHIFIWRTRKSKLEAVSQKIHTRLQRISKIWRKSFLCFDLDFKSGALKKIARIQTQQILASLCLCLAVIVNINNKANT